MKIYRNPRTGHKVKVDEDDAATVASLEARGYVEWGAADQKEDSGQCQGCRGCQSATRRRRSKEVVGRYPVAEART